MREFVGGMEEIGFSRQGVIDLPSRHINDFLQNGNRKQIELVYRPGDETKLSSFFQRLLHLFLHVFHENWVFLVFLAWNLMKVE